MLKTKNILARAIAIVMICGSLVSLNLIHGAAVSQTSNINPAADAYVDASQATTNHGSATTLRVDASPVVTSYLRFVLPSLNGQTISQASLRVHANSGSTQGLVVKAVSNNSWGETTITYANAPTAGNSLASSPAVTPGSWVTLNVSSYVKTQGTFSFSLSTPGSTAISLSARESGANAPQLILSLTTGSTPAATKTSTATAVKTTTVIPSTPTPTAGVTNTVTRTAVPSATPTSNPTVPAAAGLHVMRVEYADYATSRADVPSWDLKMKAAGINMVALAAGRVEWAYFKWAGHNADWASAITDTGIDILADDSSHYGQYAQINAVIDVFAPNYISAHPDKAAISATGVSSPNLVSTAELVNGAFGQKLLDMVSYIAANYPNVGSISITELSYRVDGYGAADLALFKAATGKTDWPRLSNGQINIDDPAIGTWRSDTLGKFLAKATALAHQYGKQLYMDVSVNYDNLPLMTNNKGTNYVTMLQNVDKIVVWDYFGEAGYPPQISQDIGKFLTQFGLDRVILSVGLWGPSSGSVISSSDFQAGIVAAQAGGMPNIWICPGSMLSSTHWQVLNQLWGPH